MQRCGLCAMVSGALRRVMCVGSRRGSSESYYRELGDQDTLKIEDRSSDLSDDAEEETSLCHRCRMTPRASPQSSPRASPRTSPRTSRQASPRSSPLPSRQPSPRTTPQPSRQASLKISPGTSRQASHRTSPLPSRHASRKTSPPTCRKASRKTSPPPSRQASPQTSPRPSQQVSPRMSPKKRQAPLKGSPEQSRKASLQTSPLPSRQTSPQSSRKASLKTSPRLSRRTSRLTSPGSSRWTSPPASPKTSPQTSRKTSPRTSPQTSRQTSPRASPLSSRRTSPKTSPWSSRRSSRQSSPSSSRLSLLKSSWLKYTRGSHLHYLHSEVATDSMEERDPEHYEMKIKKTSPGRFLTMHKRRKKRLLTRCLFHDRGLLDDLMLGQVQCVLNQSVDWNFNAFTLETVSGGRCLPVLCVHLFQMYGLLAHFQLDATKAWKLFSLIEEGYHSSNPYHNSIHAADVTQAMHTFLSQERILAHLTPLEIMASLLAAIAHDLDHPGVNQPFLIATSNHLAALYQNTSVLENHHWRSAMSCLVESGILDQLPPVPGLREKLMNQISSLILATDITRQQEYLTQFKNHLDTNTLDMTKSEHRHLVLQIALKCADISNPCRPWEISRKWSLKVCEEFFRQGDYERRLNLPVTALCDRHATSIPKIQTGFFKFVVTPLITQWHRFLHNELSTQMLYNLKYNQSRWEGLMNEEANKEKADISDADMLDDDLNSDSASNKSESAKLLLPPRRASLNPVTKKSPLKDQIRRFSVPLNVFQDVRLRLRERGHAALLADKRARLFASAADSQSSLHSQLSVRGHSSQTQESDKVLSVEKLLPDSTIASITTTAQAVRLNTVFREDDTPKQPIKQKTSPPVEATFCDSSEDSEFVPYRSDNFSPLPGTSKKEPKYRYLIVRDFKKTDSEDTSDTSVEETPRKLEKKSSGQRHKRKESSTVGSQLRDNLTRMPLELDSDPLLQRRRKSMPAEVLPFTPREKKIREVPPELPQLLRRTFSGKASWTKRRGSAPSPVAPSDSELRGLASPRHSANGSRRKPSLTFTCQQWLAKATHGVQERTLQQFARRSSLPAEVMTGISTH